MAREATKGNSLIAFFFYDFRNFSLYFFFLSINIYLLNLLLPSIFLKKKKAIAAHAYLCFAFWHLICFIPLMVLGPILLDIFVSINKILINYWGQIGKLWIKPTYNCLMQSIKLIINLTITDIIMEAFY